MLASGRFRIRTRCFAFLCPMAARYAAMALSRDEGLVKDGCG